MTTLPGGRREPPAPVLGPPEHLEGAGGPHRSQASPVPTQNPHCLLQAPQAPERLRGSWFQSMVFPSIFQGPAAPLRGDGSRQSQRKGRRQAARTGPLRCPHHKLLPTALKASVAPCGAQGQATILGWEEEAKGMKILSLPVTPIPVPRHLHGTDNGRDSQP